MKKGFFKIVAVMMAASMMSMTVYAAESAADLDGEEVELTSTQENSEPETSSSAETQEEQSQEPSESAEPARQEEAATPAEENKEAGEASGNTDGQSQEKETAPAQEETKEETPEATPENTEKTEPTDTGNSEKKSDSSEKKSSDDSEETRRTAEIASESWSNGDIEDVMGVKAESNGDTVTISYKTKHTSDWDNNFANYPLTITYPDGTTGTIYIDWDKGVHGDNWSDIPGVTVSESSDQADTLTLEISIPASYFKSADFSVGSQGYTTSVNGTAISEDVSQTDPNAVYEGISTDGNFNDWNAVTKYELNEPEGEHNVESVAWVIDSNSGYVYIYIKDDGSNSATWAGPNHNGKFAITTDLGNTMLIQLTEDGAVVAAEGYSAIHEGSQWEIAIPLDRLPANTGGLSFGLYLTDNTLTGYGDTGEVESKVDITYDGNTDDWAYYPSTLIEYATAGTQEKVVDGEAKQYCDEGENIFGYCTTEMQAHLNERGGEYTQGVSVIVNNDESKRLEMRLVTVDENGNINWNPQKQDLENGSYEYYIFGTDCWGSSTNISELVEADVCYGKATINISDTEQEMEWYINTHKLADRYGLDASDLKKISTIYKRIGPQYVTCAGTSSGPYGGAALCILSAAVPFLIKKRFIL